MRHDSGFSIIEILLSVALIGLLAGIAVPLLQSFGVKNDLDLALTTIAQTLRRAQALAQGVSGDAGWGVAVGTSTITLFHGSDFAVRNPDFDEVFDLSSALAATGTTQFAFQRLTGEPTTSGTLILNAASNKFGTLTVNEKGMIRFNLVDLGVPQADNLVIDTANAGVGGVGANLNEELQGITLLSAAASPIAIDRITVSWTNTDRRIEEIMIGGTIVWSRFGPGTPTGAQKSGTELDIQDYVLTPSTQVVPIDRFKFTGSVSGNTFTITFTMIDGSSKTVIVADQIIAP